MSCVALQKELVWPSGHQASVSLSVVSSLEEQKVPTWIIASTASILGEFVEPFVYSGRVQDLPMAGSRPPREAWSPRESLSVISHFLIGTRGGRPGVEV